MTEDAPTGQAHRNRALSEVARPGRTIDAFNETMDAGTLQPQLQTLGQQRKEWIVAQFEALVDQ